MIKKREFKHQMKLYFSEVEWLKIKELKKKTWLITNTNFVKFCIIHSEIIFHKLANSKNEI